MFKNNIHEIPTARSWETRVSAMPNIPRGEKGFQQSLHSILIELKKGTPINTKLKILGSKSENTLEDLLIRLRPSGIVKKMMTGWEVSKEADNWLELGEDLYLAAILNGNIKFFSEILAALSQESKPIKELRELASVQYRLDWKTKSEILARLNWLKDLGLIVYEDFAMKYSITEEGLEFLDLVGFIKGDELEKHTDSTISENEVLLSSWAEDFCKLSKEDKEDRKTSIGYSPGNVQAVHNTILDYLLMMNNSSEINTIVEYSSITYGISESSTKAFLSTLVHLGLIERKTKTSYQTSKLGRLFPTENFEIDFACCINKKYSFVFEILFELQKEELNAKQLAVIAKVSYDFPSEDTTNINKRLRILKNAKLIQESGMNLYGLTKRGFNFCEKFKDCYLVTLLDNGRKQDNEKEFKENIEMYTILNELRNASRDSTNPDRFELVLSKAFGILGFKSDWIGGAGKTDILVQAATSPKFSYKVAVDAKTTYSGGITEGQINFDTITDHRKKHNADYSVIVGREFQGERLIERAIKHNVGLLDIGSLEFLIKMHIEVPLKSDSYRRIFNQRGIVDIQLIEEDRRKIVRDGDLLQSIMKCLSEESEDPLTEGIMQPREIYLLLKNEFKIGPSPTIEEIKQILEFLASPLIGCIGVTKEGYYAMGSLTDAAQKFEFYLKACQRD
ncbi:hypothetical protein [Priestia flexa]|uniref:hypothetical protein n=1 Tax=Priestia flexa TaxID=86664 RepID=UPI001B327496|nr:hypothetical protein [Priestia flexa]